MPNGSQGSGGMGTVGCRGAEDWRVTAASGEAVAVRWRTTLDGSRDMERPGVVASA